VEEASAVLVQPAQRRGGIVRQCGAGALEERELRVGDRRRRERAFDACSAKLRDLTSERADLAGRGRRGATSRRRVGLRRRRLRTRRGFCRRPALVWRSGSERGGSARRGR
jgi:hypothetical protein